MNNLFIFIGRISKDLELRTTNNGTKVLELPLAIANGKDDVSFITTTLFNQVAETTSKYCKKGDILGIQGMVKNHNWEDKEGKKHYDYQFIANRVSFLSAKKENNDVSQNVKSEYDDIKSDIQLTDDDINKTFNNDSLELPF